MSQAQSSASIKENIGRLIRCLDAGDTYTPEELLAGDVLINGTILLTKKYVIDFLDITSTLVDNALDLLGRKVTLQLVSVDFDSKTNAPKVSTKFSIKHWAFTDDTKPGDSIFAVENYQYLVTFRVPRDFGEIGAFFIRNNHRSEFYLISVSLEYPDKSTTDFFCNSWVYNTSFYKNDRVFFTNKALRDVIDVVWVKMIPHASLASMIDALTGYTLMLLLPMYLPEATPAGLKALRSQELQELRGDGTGMRKEGERIYDYDVYNDLQTESSRRPILGGSARLPYPRRCRTGRPRASYDTNSEATLSESGVSTTYVPRDERFTRVKNSGFLASSIKGVAHFIIPALTSYFDDTPNEFASFDEIKALYDTGINLEGRLGPSSAIKTKSKTPAENPFILLDTIFDADGADKSVMHYALPDIIASDDRAWMLDEEFGRQTLAGTNPITIQLLTDFPPKSSLDPNVYGPATVLETKHMLPYIEDMTVPEALKANRLFIIDHHDAFMTYLERIHSIKDHAKSYASRVILFYNTEGKMKPIAIELSLPPPPGANSAIRRVFTPPNGATSEDEKDYLWELAKLHASSLDFGVHELVNHWLRAHAVMEPICIATHRQLSQMHPILGLLYPICRNTMNINASARSTLINAGGIIEKIFTPGLYSMEVSSMGYASWQFDKQGLPQDLIARGMALPVADSSLPGGVKLVIEDYPYAKDGLDMWESIHTWVSKYVNIAYTSDQAVQQDTELQSWWDEIINVGHGDLKDAPWWPRADSRNTLVEILTTISWIAGPHHAALNFGQYAYAGFAPNYPSMTRRFIPEVNSPEYKELMDDPEKFLLSSITSEPKATIGMAMLELLATHSIDEEYQGQRLSSNWTSEPRLQAAFSEFSASMADLEDQINARNTDPSLNNRRGKCQVPYTLLFPSSTSGLTGRGVPYSVSI